MGRPIKVWGKGCKAILKGVRCIPIRLKFHASLKGSARLRVVRGGSREAREGSGGPGKSKRARGEPPSCFRIPWSSWPSSWPFPGFPGTPSNHLKMRSAIAYQALPAPLMIITEPPRRFRLLRQEKSTETNKTAEKHRKPTENQRKNQICRSFLFFRIFCKNMWFRSFQNFRIFRKMVFGVF